MNSAEYESFYNHSLQDYAREKVKAGNWSEAEALEKSREVFAKLLPNGLLTPDHFLFTIVHAETKNNAGHLWVAWNEKPPVGKAYIYDFYIAPQLRGQGLGKHALELCEQEMKQRQATSLALHVFGHNTTARALYERAGFEVTNVNMRKMI